MLAPVLRAADLACLGTVSGTFCLQRRHLEHTVPTDTSYPTGRTGNSGGPSANLVLGLASTVRRWRSHLVPSPLSGLGVFWVLRSDEVCSVSPAYPKAAAATRKAVRVGMYWLQAGHLGRLPGRRL